MTKSEKERIIQIYETLIKYVLDYRIYLERKEYEAEEKVKKFKKLDDLERDHRYAAARARIEACKFNNLEKELEKFKKEHIKNEERRFKNE